MKYSSVLLCGLIKFCMSRDHRCNGCALVTCELSLADFRIKNSRVKVSY